MLISKLGTRINLKGDKHTGCPLGSGGGLRFLAKSLHLNAQLVTEVVASQKMAPCRGDQKGLQEVQKFLSTGFQVPTQETYFGKWTESPDSGNPQARGHEGRGPDTGN